MPYNPRGIGATDIDNVREIIIRWAPVAENNTKAYIRAAAAEAGVGPNALIEIGNAKNPLGYGHRNHPP